MSEDRNQAPSKLRRQQAREHGQVAQSPELTGAAGLLGAVIVLGFWGADLSNALTTLIREPLTSALILHAEPGELVGRLRLLTLAVLKPLAPITGGFLLFAFATHQAQVRGLWAPSLLAPEPSRLWTLGQGQGVLMRGGRGVWSLLKAVVILLVAGWAMRLRWTEFQQFSQMDVPKLTRAVGHSLWLLSAWLAVAMVVLGLIDFALQYRRFESLLQTTPQEQREDQKSTEGDPALRSRRRGIARSRRVDSAEVFAGATLALTGSNGLTLILAGGPPPRVISVRSIAQGASGLRLRNSAESARILQVNANDLARRLAGRRAPALPIPAELLAELASVWPVPGMESRS